MDAITNLINQIDTWVWGWWMILLLLGTHIFMTIRTGVIQRKIGTAIKLSVTKDPDGEGEVSQFGALTTALASTIGTGNIIGVGTAIALGGPGAVLWCWLTGVFGIATKYSESLIAVKYRVKTKDGRMQGGAMYALERGLHMKWLGLIFAIFGGFASFGIGCATQVNAIATVCQENLHIPPAAVGIAVAVLTALVIFGGIKAIANVCEKLVPFMAAFYVVGCFIILCINYDFIIPAVVTICKMAFTPGAAAGGLVGRGIMMAMQYGIARGLFSNESGMGSAPIAAAAAQTNEPVRQGLVSMTGTFIDTIIVCTMTGLAIVMTGAWDMGLEGVAVTTKAFALGLPFPAKVSAFILMMCLVFFAFTTILGWAYYSERCLEYLVNGKKFVITVFKWLYILAVFIGPFMTVSAVWTIADICNGLMAFPNLVALLALNGEVVSETIGYLERIGIMKTAVDEA